MEKEQLEQELENTKELWKFISEFINKYREAEKKLPYHINVIDELHANENAHSRILAKLLQHKTYGKFEILESFIQYLKEKSSAFGNIKVESPIITQETERIDLWIRDGKTYAIIIENKVHYAGDQEQQLERYIDKTKKEGFEKNEQIFVVYLSPQGEEPSEQSWGEYKDVFKERYLNLSFRDDILTWLKDNVLPNVRLKDKFLSSALEQYIDHLEGRFSLRAKNNTMNMELQKFLNENLGLNETPEKNIAKVIAMQEAINAQFQLLIKSIVEEIPVYFKNFISEKYKGDLVPFKEDTRGEIDFAGLIIPIEGINIRVFTGFEPYQNKLFCQVDTHDESQKTADGKYPDLPAIIYEKIKFLREKDGNSQIWQFFGRYDYSGVFECFKEVVSILTK